MEDFTLAPLGILSFFEKNGIISTVSMTVFGYGFNELTSEIFNNIFMPVINGDEDEKNKLEDKCFYLHGYEFKYGKILLALIKLFVTMYLVYIITLMVKKVSK